MVDFAKRAAKAGVGVLRADETVLAATNVLPTPFAIAGSGAIGGAIAGGVVGTLVGSAVDKRRANQAEGGGELVPALANRQAADGEIPKNGALMAVTEHRIIVWAISGLGKPKDVLFDVPYETIDAIAWQQADPKWIRSSPKSVLFWIGIGGESVMPAAAVTMGPAAKYVHAVIEALAQRLPGKVQEFSP